MCVGVIASAMVMDALLSLYYNATAGLGMSRDLWLSADASFAILRFHPAQLI